MNINTIDLNLLRVLDALLQEHHVSKAAQRVNLSQPALSNALNRLREQLGDPLFVRVGNRMQATPRALALAEPVSTALQTLQAALQEGADFDPAHVHATTTIMSTDYVAAVLLPQLIPRLHAQAPHLRVAIVTHSESNADELLGSGRIDLALIGPSHRLSGKIKQQRLFDEHFVCLTRKQHPSFRKGMNLDRYCAADHLMISPTGGGFHSNVDDYLLSIQRQRRVVLSLSQFLLATQMITQSDLIMTTGVRLAQQVQHLPLQQFTVPFDVPAFTIFQAWHARLDRDPLQRWLRHQVYETAQALKGNK